MDTFFGRYRNTSILVAVLFAQVLALAVQVKRPNESGSTRLIRVWVVNTVTPLEKLLVSSGHGARGFWGNYLYLRGVRRENRELRQELDQLRIEQVRLREDAVQAHRLQALFSFKEQFVSGTVPAQVIGTSGSDLSRVFYIDKGAKDGIKVDMAVITPGGIVGKVLRVFNSSSQVLGINDASSGVGAILEKSRLQGILQGTAAGDVVMRYVMSDEKVEAGERVLTSGGDRIFPKGLPIGTVEQTSPGSDLFLNIRVKPSANLGRVEEVLVITKVVEKEPETTEASGPIRASDILAERLPSVQKKAAPEATGQTKAASGATATTPAVQNAAAIAKAAGTEPHASKPGLSGPPTVSPTTASGSATPAEAHSGKPGLSGPVATSGSSASPQKAAVTQAGTANPKPAATPAKPSTATTTAPKQPDRFSPPTVRPVSAAKPVADQSGASAGTTATSKPKAPAPSTKLPATANPITPAPPSAPTAKPAEQSPPREPSQGDVTR